MLVLSRKANEAIVINDDIVITVVSIRQDVVRLGIECPRDRSIVRDQPFSEPSMSPEELGFIAEIHANPYDDTPRLIYADWLEERGDPRAEYLRLECQLSALKPGDALFGELRPRFEQLRGQVNSWWMAEVGRTRIRNCGSPAFRCPQRWERLTTTDSAGIRKCDACGRVVFYCKTAEEGRRRARQGYCVALDSSVTQTDFEVEQRGGLPALAQTETVEMVLLEFVDEDSFSQDANIPRHP